MQRESNARVTVERVENSDSCKITIKGSPTALEKARVNDFYCLQYVHRLVRYLFPQELIEAKLDEAYETNLRNSSKLNL
uniref:K Homology domain-containing protein n=1 Tax=Romanomermis culicivorax TaxID=13658 RepID=A0A915JM53_ROMCU